MAGGGTFVFPFLCVEAVLLLFSGKVDFVQFFCDEAVFFGTFVTFFLFNEKCALSSFFFGKRGIIFWASN